VLVALLSISAIIFFSANLYRILFPKREPSKPYNNPLSEGEQRQCDQMVVNYLQKFPQSPLREQYPYFSGIAFAATRYQEISALYDSGEMDQLEYEEELAKILPYIDLGFLNCK
jgi:hypothetical protein